MTNADIHSTSLAIAGIHATLVAIIFGALLAYVVYAQSKIDDMTGSALQEAERINTVEQASFNLRASDLRLAAGPNGPQQLANHFSEIAIGAGPRPEAAKDVEDALSALSALGNSYPFPSQAAAQGDSVLFGAPRPVKFDNLDDVRRWVTVIENAVGKTVWAANARRFGFAVQKYDDANMRAAQDQLASSLKSLSPETAARVVEDFAPNRIRPVYETLIKSCLTAIEIAAKARTDITQLDHFKARQLSRGWLIAMLAISAVFFFAFVAHPIAQVYFASVPSLPVIVRAFGPALFYGAAMIVSGVWMWRLLSR